MSDPFQHDGGAEGAPKKKGSGSFRLTREAITVLIENKATAWQICAYLSLGQHTDVTGRFTTASYRKVYEATGASPGTESQPGPARRLVKQLMAMESRMRTNTNKLIYSPEEWTGLSGELVPQTQHRMFPVAFVLNDFNSEEWIWFPNELVAGYGRFTQPLKRLKQCGDIATRLLLIAYSENNMIEFGGVCPTSYIYNRYASYNHKITSNGFTFHNSEEHMLVVAENVRTNALGVESLSELKELKEKQCDAFNDSFISLVNQGFMYEIITVMDAPADNIDSRPLYELHNKSHKVNEGEQGLVRRIDRILQKIVKGDPECEYYIADAFGRYKKTYPVISRVGVLPSVVGIYRLRFRVSNPKNYSVRAAWIRIGNDRREWINELQFLEKMFGIEHDSKDKPERIDEIIQNGDNCECEKDLK